MSVPERALAALPLPVHEAAGSHKSLSPSTYTTCLNAARSIAADGG